MVFLENRIFLLNNDVECILEWVANFVGIKIEFKKMTDSDGIFSLVRDKRALFTYYFQKFSSTVPNIVIQNFLKIFMPIKLHNFNNTKMN